MTDTFILNVNDPRWESLIYQDPAASIFHHPAWIRLLATCYGYRTFIFAVKDAGESIAAGIPFAQVNDHLTPRRWVALPFSDYCAPLYGKGEESLWQLTECLAERYREKDCPRIEIRAASPALASFETRSPYVLHTVRLESDPARVAKRAHRQQMQNVRTAEKKGVRIVWGAGLEEVQTFYRLHCENRRRLGVPAQPWNFFKLLTHDLIEKGLGFVLLAYQGDRCISGGVFLHWQQTLTYKYSATDESSLSLRPNHLVTWTAMEWGCENGYTKFDFGRADLEDQGLRDYKRRWGAEETALAYSYFPDAPDDKGTGKLGSMLHTVMSRSPVWMCRATGELLYRFVG